MRTKPRKAFDLAEVERLASLGLTREQIAAALGASASTVYNRLRDDEEFSEAVKRGEALGIGAVASNPKSRTGWLYNQPAPYFWFISEVRGTRP